MIRHQIPSLELGKMQNLVNHRREYESTEFLEQANSYLDTLRTLDFNGVKFSIGFLIAPKPENQKTDIEPIKIAQIDKRGLLNVGSQSMMIRNYRCSLFGFETVNVKAGWQMGMRFGEYDAQANTYFLPHNERVEILANARQVDGSNIALTTCRGYK